LNAVFLELSATADHYMGGRRTCGPLGYHNNPPSRKERAIAMLSANRRKINKNNLFLSTDVKQIFFKQRLVTFFNLHYFIYYLLYNAIWTTDHLVDVHEPAVVHGPQFEEQ
jgi:hypothetical protein